MKPKILLVKYLDWAILAILALALLFVAAWSFILPKSGEEQPGKDINDYEQKIQRGMKDETAQPQPPHDYKRDLRDRFEHPAVLDPYRHNPFLTREDIPYKPLQLRVGVPFRVPFKGTRFTQVQTADEKRMRVKLDYDLTTGISTVTFTPLEAGETTVRIQTDEDLIHLFKIRASINPKPLQPNSPINVVVVAQAPIEIGRFHLPAMVFISFLPDNPKGPSQTVGYSNNADVYRKPAGASDAEYVRLNAQPLVPLNREDIHKIWLTLQAPESVQGRPSPVAPAPSGPSSRPPGPTIPQEAGQILMASAAGPERPALEPAVGSFVFLDQTVDDGENYIYKIVTLSTEQDESAPCDEPYITPASTPVFVPSLVSFVIRAITADRATVRCMRRDPDTGDPLPPQDFTVGIGETIGAKVIIKFRADPGERPLPPKEVDFSTGCILVSVLPTFEIVEYGKVRVDHAYNQIYQSKFIRDPQILYLTPHGALRFKSKEKQSAP